ncbi:MAG TPA: DUF6785 family protein [Capsulimonadaceae bacterium]|jgi:hypothetical protein
MPQDTDATIRDTVDTATSEARHPRRGVPVRAMVLSLLLGPFCCYWAQDQVGDRIFSIMVPPVILTLVLVLANVPIRRFAPRFVLTEGELIVFYGMQAVMCAMASEWVDVTHPYIYSYAATFFPEPKQYVLPYISEWLFFKSGKGSLEGFMYGGRSVAYFWSHLGPWWPKILGWTTITGLAAFAMLCINALVQDQWTHREKLSFPLVQLPLAITQGGGDSPFWRNKLMWFSFAVMFGIDIMNGLNYIYPSLPSLNVRFLGDIGKWVSGPPWNAIGWMPIGLFPFMMAIGIFMPIDLLGSLLFFYFFRKAEQIVAASMGYAQGTFGGGALVPSPPYFTEQSWGAFIGLFVGAVWAARPYLKEVWGEIRCGSPAGSERVSPRGALVGLISSVVLLGLIGTALGMPFLYVITYVTLFLVFSTALTRLTAQLGAPTHEMAFMGPTQLFADFHGTAGFSNDLIARTVTTFHFMNRLHRTHPMPTQLDALYLAGRSKVSPKGMFFALVVATIAGTLIGHLVRTYLDFRLIPVDMSGDTTNLVRKLVSAKHPPDPSAMMAVGAGFGAVMLLDLVRFQIPGFPLHPAGFALAMNFGVDYYWFGLLIALIAKSAVMRYKGMGGFESLRTVALGIMLGEFVAEAVWAIFSMMNYDQFTYTISINSKMNWMQ